MNKGPALLLLVCLAAAHPGLADDKNAATTPSATSDTVPVCAPTALFMGELPCADCAGIETYLTLDQDGTAVLTSRYLSDEPNMFTERGTWSVKDNLVNVALADDTRTFKPLSNDALMMVGPGGEASAALADAYTLKRATPLTATSFTGVYHLVDPDSGGAYPQTLTITTGDGGTAQVSVGGKDCEFQGEGSVVNDHIELPFKTGGPNQAAVMIIRQIKDRDAVDLFTSDHDERYALNYFCRGGATLAGEYVTKPAPDAK